jgi:catechol 2,3-dioxygenase-like lactoylglutathione lyase family enzyme
MDRAIAFYQKWCRLGIVKDRRKEGGSTVWLGMPNCNKTLPEFILVLDPADGPVEHPINHLGFQCQERSDIDNIANQARQAEILVYEPHDSGGSVGYWTLIRDPDGHLIEFTYGQPLSGLS